MEKQAQNLEPEISFPAVEDSQVKRLLDLLGSKKPYGGQRMAVARKALEVMALDVASYAHHNIPYTLDDWKVEAFAGVVDGLGAFRAKAVARRALVEFIEDRGTVITMGKHIQVDPVRPAVI
jgi:hypothetical protein